jgi:hypothetical protein
MAGKMGLRDRKHEFGTSTPTTTRTRAQKAITKHTAILAPWIDWKALNARAKRVGDPFDAGDKVRALAERKAQSAVKTKARKVRDELKKRKRK